MKKLLSLFLLLCFVFVVKAQNPTVSLPFYFDNVRDSIDKTPGLSQKGLAKSVTQGPKLKFDSAGDFLQIDLPPHSGLTFSFVWYASSSKPGYSFKFVFQESADGENFNESTPFSQSLLKVEQTKSFTIKPTTRVIRLFLKSVDVSSVQVGKLSLSELLNLSIAPFGYGTYYHPDKAIIVPTGLTPYKLVRRGNAVVAQEVGLSVINPRSAVVFKGLSGNYIAETTEEVETSALDDNLLRGVADTTIIRANSATEKVYILNISGADNTPGFYWSRESNQGEMATILPNRAYLLFDSSETNVQGYQLDNNIITNINNIADSAETKAIYDLAGRRVNNFTRGIYIVGGRKFIK